MKLNCSSDLTSLSSLSLGLILEDLLFVLIYGHYRSLCRGTMIAEFVERSGRWNGG